MNQTKEILSWLQVAFTDRAHSLNEQYYVDRRDSQFFSIFFTDYFIVEEEAGESAEEVPYNEVELAQLKDRITRLDSKDSTLLWIPRLTVEERKEIMYLFLESHKYLANYNDLEKDIAHIDGRSEFAFSSSLSDEFMVAWEELKYVEVSNHIRLFLKENDIDLETSTLWTNEKMTGITLNLRDRIKSKEFQGWLQKTINK
jgi:hypothetical protein